MNHFGDHSDGLHQAADDSPFSTEPSQPQRTKELEYERDETYYCPDLVLLVENRLFRVPRRIFEEGEFFQDMFTLTPPEGQIVDGMTDQQPLRLPETYSKVEFRRFLRVLLPFGPEPTLAWDEWGSVLKLATMWGFARIRDMCIAKLSTMSLKPVEKIILARQHGVDQWLVPALNELAQREAALELVDTECLEPVVGWAFILRIAKVRETILQSGTSSSQKAYCGYCGMGRETVSGTRGSHDFTDAIIKIFGLSEAVASPRIGKGKVKKGRV